jgi:hypothetical protein
MQNHYVIKDGVVYITLLGKHGGTALIDVEDLPIAEAEACWRKTTHGFVAAKIPMSNGNKVHLHKLISKSEGRALHFENENKLDCRKANLIVMGPKIAPRGSQDGIFFEREKYRVMASLNGKRINIGRFPTREAALIARATFMAEHGIAPGIYFDKKNKKWRSYFKHEYLGLFKTRDAAIKAQMERGK